MRFLRPIILVVAIVAAFYYFTTHRRGAVPEWVSRPGKVEITEAAGPQTLDAEEQNNISVYKKVLPAVVNITSTAVAFDFFYGPMPQQGQGSGFIIDKQGHILTNYHVVAEARQLEVTLANRKKYTAQVVGTDPAHDLAVIKIDAPNLEPAVLGDSHSLVVGQKVYAIGNPFGLAGTLTRGIISSIRQVRLPNGAELDEVIQTDAAINPGNSGGPLLNYRGEVIGINTMILSSVGQSSGVGFAVPINLAKSALNDLVQFGRVRRPSLGVRNALPIGPELARELGLPADAGVLIMQLTPGGAAERAGLRGGTERAYIGNVAVLLGGDLIVAIAGEEVADPQDVARIMNKHKAGDTVTVKVYRGNRTLNVPVTLGEARRVA